MNPAPEKEKRRKKTNAPPLAIAVPKLHDIPLSGLQRGEDCVRSGIERPLRRARVIFKDQDAALCSHCFLHHLELRDGAAQLTAQLQIKTSLGRCEGISNGKNIERIAHARHECVTPPLSRIVGVNPRHVRRANANLQVAHAKN